MRSKPFRVRGADRRARTHPAHRLLRLALALVLCLPVVPTDAVAQDGEALLARLRDRFESIRTLRASFGQRSTSPLFEGSTEALEGTLYVQGEAYRLESGGRTLVNDGRTLWIYDAAERQVIVSDYEEDAYTFSITGFLYRFDERYRFDTVERRGDRWVIHLLPRDPDDFFRSVAVTMRDTDALVTEVRVTDANDVTMVFTLADLVENPELPDGVFRFDPPEGVEIVDLRN